MQKENVSEQLSMFRLLILGCQHVLVMYAGAIAPPLILGAALSLPKEQIAFLINADLFVCGLVSIIQSRGVGNIGIRLPVMMGVTFTALAPMIAIGANPEGGLLAIFGSTIAAGFIGLLIAPYVGKLLRFFPPVVTGTQLTAVGLSLMGVAAAWSAGGYGNPDFGNPFYIGIASLVLVIILALIRYTSGFISNVAVLLGLIIGFLIAASFGQVSVGEFADTPWFGFIMPFHFGMPSFSFWPILAMTIVMLVVFIESTGMIIGLGEMVGKEVKEQDLVRAYRADGLGAMLGGVFNTFTYTSFAQNVGLVGMTGVKSRWVCVTAGVILMVLGLFPKIAILVASIPPYVLGGAGIVMFGVVTASGIKILNNVDFRQMRNIYIVAISLGLGMIPVVSPDFFSKMPSELAPILQSPILLTAIAAIALNIYFNGVSNAKVDTSLLDPTLKKADSI